MKGTFVCFLVLMLLAGIFLPVTHAEETGLSASPEVSSAPKTDIETNAIKKRIESDFGFKKERITEARKKAREKALEAKKEFKENLKTVKEEKKREKLERLVGKFDSVNSKWVNHWQGILEKLSRILDKLDARAQKLKIEGKDISAYEVSATTARQKIADASTILEKQAEKNYILDGDSEAKFVAEVKSVTRQFKENVSTTHDAVKDAKEAIHDAFMSLKSLKNNDE